MIRRYKSALYCCCAVLILFSPLSFCADETKDLNKIFRLGGTVAANYGISIRDTEIALGLLFNEFLSSVGEQSRIKIYPDVSTLIADLKAVTLDGFYITTLELLGYEDLINPDFLYAFQINGSHKRKFVLMVRKESAIESLHALQGKKIGLTQSSDIGSLFVNVSLLRLGLPVIDNYFDKQISYRSSHEALVALFFKQIDAAIVTMDALELSQELNPQIGKATIPFLVSEDLLSSFTSVRKDFPRDRMEKFSYVAATLHESPRGKHLLNTFKAEKIVRIDSNDLEPVRELHREYQTLLAR
jgi:ABC-type phosphate/phosphonate transport system substrate-binding protein